MENLQKLARMSMSFSDFHERTLEDADQQERTNYRYYKNETPNLKRLAQLSMNFEEFHQRVLIEGT